MEADGYGPDDEAAAARRAAKGKAVMVYDDNGDETSPGGGKDTAGGALDVENERNVSEEKSSGAGGEVEVRECLPVKQCTTDDGHEYLLLEQPQGASAKVFLFGAQVTSWTNNQGKELLFFSKKASHGPPSGVRGGIQICFPQYNSGRSSSKNFFGVTKFTPIEDFGIARNRLWHVEETNHLHGDVVVNLILECTDISCELRLRVRLKHNGNLVLTSRVKNVDQERNFTFCFAFRCYLSVSKISDVRVAKAPLKLQYRDNLDQGEEIIKMEQEENSSISFDSQVDRIYFDTLQEVVVHDHMKINSIRLKNNHGLPDLVLWNPWKKMAKGMDDFGRGEYETMLVVGTAVAKERVTLLPEEEWFGEQELVYIPSC